MNVELKQRLVGIIILAIFLAIAIPFLISGSKKPNNSSLQTTDKFAISEQNKQPEIQFNTPSGDMVKTQTDTNADAKNLAPAPKSQINDADRKKETITISAEQNKPPVFQHQVITKTEQSNNVTTGAITNDTDNTTTSSPTGELQQSIAQKESEIITAPTIRGRHKQLAKIKPGELKSDDPKQNNHQRVAKGTSPRKKVIAKPAATEMDLQRVLAEEQEESPNHYAVNKRQRKSSKIATKNNLIDQDI